jgi:predicted nucleic acid-binding protein
LIDTTILVDSRLGDPPAVQFVLDMLHHTGQIVLSEYSALVLMTRCDDAAALSQLRTGFLANNRVLPITAPISHRAYRILESLAPPSPLTADDAIVAATAIAHKLPLYTLDPARFAAVPGLTAILPY